MKPRVWLVIEYHCYLPEPTLLQRFCGITPDEPTLVSVWVSGRPLPDDKELAEDVARKLVGPILVDDAYRMVDTLREQLELAGVDSVLKEAADD